jgi:hypothetical protein
MMPGFVRLHDAVTTPQQVAGTPAHSLTWTGDHHLDAPGHGSLVLAGQGGPVSGAYWIA